MISVPYICRFMPFKEKGKADAALRCRVSWEQSSRIVSVNVGFRVDPAKWDSKMQRCAPGSFHGPNRTPAATVNRAVDALRARVEEAFAGFCAKDVVPSVSALRAALKGPSASTVTFKQAFIAYMSEHGGISDWADTTYARFDACLNNIPQFLGTKPVEDINVEDMERCVLLWRESGKTNSTVNIYCGMYVSVLTWAARKKHLGVDPEVLQYSPALKVPKNPVLFLTWEELMRLWSAEFSDEYDAMARDVFCFCAFTSLRFSDAMALRWSNVHPHHISITTRKTVEPLLIELNHWSESILDKYLDVGFPDDRVLPSIPQSVMISHLRACCRKVGIDAPFHRVRFYNGKRVEESGPKWKFVSSHTARKTFVCQALSRGISPSIVMKWTGHSGYEAMKPYIDIAESAKTEAMRVFDAAKTPESVPELQ